MDMNRKHQPDFTYHWINLKSAQWSTKGEIRGFESRLQLTFEDCICTFICLRQWLVAAEAKVSASVSAQRLTGRTIPASLWGRRVESCSGGRGCSPLSGSPSSDPGCGRPRRRRSRRRKKWKERKGEKKQRDKQNLRRQRQVRNPMNPMNPKHLNNPGYPEDFGRSNSGRIHSAQQSEKL